MAQWPAWLVPPAGGTAQGVEMEMSRNPRGVSKGSVDALPALPPCDPVGVSGDVDLAVSAVIVKPRAMTRIAPLHDLSPGSGETWLLGRFVRWSVDRLNALDRKTARTIPALEKEASHAKRRVKRAVQRELTNQFPPLQVYLADRAFALDEARNAEARRAREARAREEAGVADAKPNDADSDSARRSESSKTADVGTASTGAVAMTPSSKRQDRAGTDAREERPARRKMTDFFAASGGSAEAKAPVSAAPATAVDPPSATRADPPPPTTEEVAREISRASETFSKQARTETKAEREARWASEGAALAASLAATSRPKTPKKSRRETTAANPAGFFPTEPQAEKNVRGGKRVSRGHAEARAATVASAARLALAPPVTSPDPPTRLAAPNPATMEKPRAEPAPPRVATPADRRRGDRADAARRERRARRAQARTAREDGSLEDGSSRRSSVAPPEEKQKVGSARTGDANPPGSRARLAAPGIQPRRAAVSRETESAVDRMMARSTRVPTAGALPDDGTPSKHRRRAFGDGAANGAKRKNVLLAEKMDRLASSLAAAAASAAGALSELAEQAYDGGEEFAADANKENKIRTESVVTVSVDGSDVLVHTRKVAVEGKQI